MNTRVLLSHRARRVFIVVHLWLGLFLGAWFSLIGVTGSLLAWRDELGAAETAWRYPVQKPTSDASIISIEQATKSLQTTYPDLDLTKISAVTIPSARSAAYSFTIGRDRRQARSILVDPYNARVLGTIQPRTGITATINQLHARLLGGIRSYVSNGLLTVLAVPLLLSGLWLWWPSNIRQLKARLAVKRGTSFKRTLYDLHNVLGIYLYVVLFTTTVTGALLVRNHIARDGLAQTLQELKSGGAPSGGGEGRRGARREGGRGEGRTGGARENAGRPGQTPARNAERESEPTVTVGKERLGTDALLQAARNSVSGYEITRLQLPQNPEDAFRASYVVPTGFTTNQTVFIDPYTGKVLPAPTAGAGYNEVVRGLHFGNFGGTVTKLLYTFAGLMPPGLFITGVLLWWRKKRAKTNARKKRHNASSEESLVVASQ